MNLSINEIIIYLMVLFMVLGAVDRMGPERIVYISCNPETQRRDLRLLAGWGWRARLLQPVDLFPHTEHVECVAVLAKIRGGGM